MPKATLSFTLPEEQEEFRMAQQGGDYYCVLSSLLEEMRRICKYGCDERHEEYIKALEDMRKFAYDELRDGNLEI